MALHTGALRGCIITSETSTTIDHRNLSHRLGPNSPAIASNPAIAAAISVNLVMLASHSWNQCWVEPGTPVIFTYKKLFVYDPSPTIISLMDALDCVVRAGIM